MLFDDFLRFGGPLEEVRHCKRFSSLAQRLSMPQYTRQVPPVPSDFSILSSLGIPLPEGCHTRGFEQRTLDGLSQSDKQAIKTRQAELRAYRDRLLHIQASAWRLVEELVSHSPVPTQYGLFRQDAKQRALSPKEVRKKWASTSAQVKNSFATLAKRLAITNLSQIRSYVEVLSGQGWREDRAVFFPASAKRCLMMLLLCQLRQKAFPALICKESIFPFIPFDWFFEGHGRESRIF